MQGSKRERVGMLSALAVGEFRAMWLAELLSSGGDQLARVALSVLVYQRTNSAALTGLTYALTFVPQLAGGILLSWPADRYPRREVMIAADIVRAALVAGMAVPGTPLWLLCVLVAVTTFTNAPFKAAQGALLPDVLRSERLFTAGMNLRSMCSQFVQLLAFSLGGFLVSAIDPNLALGLNAGTFVASAVILAVAVTRRPPPSAPGTRPASLGSTWQVARQTWRDPRQRALVGVMWLATFYVVPEALAAPYAASLGTGAVAVGLLMAADPIGSIIGSVTLRWLPPKTGVRLIGVFGIVAGLPLVLCVLHPGLVTSMILFGIGGVLATWYHVQGSAQFTLGLPEAQRGQGAGLLSTGLQTGQGLGALAAGLVADQIGAADTIALAGGLGVITAVPLAALWARARAGRAELPEKT
ncbi:MFS transporter [Kibdelosporangium phytohabitans]|uniref:MFS transporter n=1 Tax=Kibdelosporangium phytohabitans TaxID=860235 RepID=A0A0N9I6P3_9PSEU|nr:MFS transporter [Kibdelosporangium phytohabitans]ALG14561.1 MFS transporter [Kibdelosporangium phytohabitans]MBE1467552.1 MFS family permease [Kibdelosporangium phytohabitans]